MVKEEIEGLKILRYGTLRILAVILEGEGRRNNLIRSQSEGGGQWSMYVSFIRHYVVCQ